MSKKNYIISEDKYESGYAEVQVPAVQMIDALKNGTPIQLLPAFGANKYVVLDKMLVEFSAGTTAFNTDWTQLGGIENGTVGTDVAGLEIIGGTIPTHLGDWVTAINFASSRASNNNSKYISFALNQPVTYAFEGDGLTSVGTGETKFKIWYSVHTFNPTTAVA